MGIQIREYAESIAFLDATMHERHWAASSSALHLIVLAQSHLTVGDLQAGDIGQSATGIKDIMNGCWVLIKELPRMGKMAAAGKRIQALQNEFDDLDKQYFKRVKNTNCPSQGMLEAQMLLDDASVATTASPHTPNGSVVPEVVLNDVCLSTPDGKFKLSQHLNLVVDRSTSVIIIGASGCGKSSLLRAISGLWEPTS